MSPSLAKLHHIEKLFQNSGFSRKKNKPNPKGVREYHRNSFNLLLIQDWRCTFLVVLGFWWFVLVIWGVFVRSKSKWLVLKMFFCLKTANAKMLNIQCIGLRLTEAGRFFSQVFL